MQDFDALVAMLPVQLWAAAAILAIVLFACILVARRTGSARSLAAVLSVPALIVIAWSAWNFVDNSVLRQRAIEREALNLRAIQVTAAAMAPGSALACLEGIAGEAVEDACEKAVFANPAATAAATTYVEAKLRLLADGLDYSRRSDPAYAGSLAGLLQAIQNDRFGFVAHVLAARDGCTAEACGFFALLTDASVVKANLAAQTYERKVAEYAAGWTDRSIAAAPAESPAVATMTSVPLTKPIDFPSAASIPPVSIMTGDPAETAPKVAAEAPPPKPAAPATARRPANSASAVRGAPLPPATPAALPQ